MKTKLVLVLASIVVLAGPSAVFAQAPPNLQPNGQVSVILGDDRHGKCPPKPEPQGARHDTCRGDLEFAFGFSYLRFQSSQFNANTFGLTTDVSYYVQPWMTVEGQVNSGWGTQTASSFLAQSFIYTGGIRVIVPREEKVRPWAHALIGGMHMLPQTAFGPNGFAAQLGGGADIRLKYWLWLRVEANYVRSQMYTQGQNNLQVGSGIVYRF